MKANTVSRRAFLRGAALTGGAAALAACAPPPTAPAPAAPAAPAAADKPTEAAPVVAPAAGGPIKMVLWGWWKERMTLFENAAKDFAQKDGGVEFAMEVFDKDFWPKLYAAIAANTQPTLSKMQTTNYFKLRGQDALVPLPEDLFQPALLKKNFPNHAWDDYGYYVAPEGNQIAMLTYNKKMFSDAGLDPQKPPTTWDEFFAAAEKLTQRDSKDAITVAGYQYDDWLPVLNPLYQQGGKVVKDEGGKLTANVETPEMTKAFGFFQDAVEKHKVMDVNLPYFTDAIGNNQAAMTISEAWGYGEWKKGFPDTFANLGFAAPPTPTGKAEPLFGRQNAVLSLSAMKGRPAEETNKAFQFINYLVSQRLDTQYDLAAISGLVPAHAEILKDPKVTNDPFTSMAAQLVGQQYDAVEVGGPLNKALGDALSRMILEKAPIADVLTTAQAELQKTLDAGELKFLRG